VRARRVGSWLRRLAAAPAGEPPAQAARRIAQEQGRDLGTSERAGSRAARGQPLAAAGRTLQRLGYAPTRDGERLTLANCPFHAIVQVVPEVTCAVNLALIEGLLTGLDLDKQLTAHLQPRADACCVTLAGATAEGA